MTYRQKRLYRSLMLVAAAYSALCWLGTSSWVLWIGHAGDPALIVLVLLFGREAGRKDL